MDSQRSTDHYDIHSWDRKSEHPVGRVPSLMKLFYLRHEAAWFGGCGKVHIVIISEKEVYLRFGIVILSPSSHFRHQARHHSVDSTGGMIFALN